MKQTEDEVIKISEKVIKDLNWTYEEGSIIAIFNSIEMQTEQVSTQKEHPKYQEFIELLSPYWSVTLDFPEDDNWKGRNVMFIKIKDETGEAYEVGHRQSKSNIIKNSNGKYEVI